MKLKDNLDFIINDLRDNKLTIHQIADKYDVSYSAVQRLNGGETYHNDIIDYPIRKSKGINSNLIAKGFIHYYKNRGYGVIPLWIIMGNIDFWTVRNYYNNDTGVGYHACKEYENRRRIYDTIITPHKELINNDTNILTKDEYKYIKFMRHFLGSNTYSDAAELCFLFKDKINSYFIDEPPIKSLEDMKKYIAWVSMRDCPNEFVKEFFNVYSNKYNFYKNTAEEIYFDDFDISLFGINDILSIDDLYIVVDMINMKKPYQEDRRKPLYEWK